MFAINLAETNVWITGGSRGIGKHCAEYLAKAGANIGITFLNKEREALITVDECIKHGVKAYAIKCDVSDPDECRKSYNFFLEKMGPINVLINNAGVVKDDLFITSEADDWNLLFKTNVFGPLYCIQLAAKDMLMHRRGKIINITSAAATKGGRGQAIYSATKGAVEAATRSIAVELGRKGITVNSIAPGVIETDMSKGIRDVAAQEILDRQVIKRFGLPQEIAAWVVMLCSSYSDFITGQTFHIDGGLKMP